MTPLKFEGVLETVLYYRRGLRDDMRRFYGEVLGLPSVSEDPDSFRVGRQVILLFDPDESSVQDDPPPHGATGNVHACLLSAAQMYEGWKRHLLDEGIEIVREIEWPNGARSFYFADPSGNVLEIANADLWGR